MLGGNDGESGTSALEMTLRVRHQQALLVDRFLGALQQGHQHGTVGFRLALQLMQRDRFFVGFAHLGLQCRHLPLDPVEAVVGHLRLMLKPVDDALGLRSDLALDLLDLGGDVAAQRMLRRIERRQLGGFLLKLRLLTAKGLDQRRIEHRRQAFHRVGVLEPGAGLVIAGLGLHPGVLRRQHLAIQLRKLLGDHGVRLGLVKAVLAAVILDRLVGFLDLLLELRDPGVEPVVRIGGRLLFGLELLLDVDVGEGVGHAGRELRILGLGIDAEDVGTIKGRHVDTAE